MTIAPFPAEADIATTKRILLRLLARKSSNTTRGYLADLRKFATWLGRGGLSGYLMLTERAAKAKISAYYRAIAESTAPRSVQRAASTLSSFINAAQSLHIVNWNLPKPELVRAPRYASHSMKPSEMEVEAIRRKLIRLGREVPWKRNLAIFDVICSTGLLPCELAALKVADLEPKSGILRVPSRGSGEVVIVPLTEEAVATLEEWIQISQAAPDDPLFPRIYGAPPWHHSMGPRSFHEVVKICGRRGGLRSPLRPRHLRALWIRSAAGNAVGGPLRLVDVQRLTRHRKIDSIVSARASIRRARNRQAQLVDLR